jgi:hypothetical protein
VKSSSRGGGGLYETPYEGKKRKRREGKKKTHKIGRLSVVLEATFELL